jgi:hypothetical protein
MTGGMQRQSFSEYASQRRKSSGEVGGKGSCVDDDNADDSTGGDSVGGDEAKIIVKF